MPDELVVLFPDTNVLLHFRSLREIDWPVVTDAKAVKLVLCSAVIHELDQKTYDPKLSQRAKAVAALAHLPGPGGSPDERRGQLH